MTLTAEQERVLARVFADPAACELYQSHALQLTSISRRARRAGRWLVTLGAAPAPAVIRR